MAHALDTLERALNALHADARCEVFQRHTRRVSIDFEQGRTQVRHGAEQGTAVRLRADDGALHFAAVSGLGVESAREARVLASSNPGVHVWDGTPPWAGAGRLVDAEGPADLPGIEAMEAWLRSAAGSARGCLDAVVGVEALGTGDGLRTCRVRGFVWARRLEGSRVQSAVARRLERLDFQDWEDPEPIDLPEVGRSHVGDIALLPAAVAAVAPALVAATRIGSPAGPGWVCHDDPAESEALAGGLFDDTGFPVQSLQLADGRQVLAQPRGPGRRRRHSFREPPMERAANLKFLPRGTWDGDGVLARAARIHATGPEWSVVLDASFAKEGRPGGAWSPWVVRARPEAWVASCRAVVPPLRRTPEGVLSGTLVFDGRKLRPCEI